MDRELKNQAMLERVELIARLTNEGARLERDREIALNLIAEISADSVLLNRHFLANFSVNHIANRR